MEAIAAMVTPGNVLCDVGTDHGYIPIRLVQAGVVPRAIAMDLREGPLARAKEHIEQEALSEHVETRLSDGVAALMPGEAESIVIAGMGGELEMHILTAGETVCKAAKELILQPQSELGEVRAFLREHGYVILAEDMVFEDGKYYPMMRVGIWDRTAEEKAKAEAETEVEDPVAKEQKLADLYGPFLLSQKHPVLQQYLVWQESHLSEILAGLKKQPDSEKIAARIAEVEQKLAYNKAAANRFME